MLCKGQIAARQTRIRPHEHWLKICIGITRDVMKMMDEGKRLKDIRTYIEKTYSHN